jgi:hypothetical protein
VLALSLTQSELVALLERLLLVTAVTVATHQLL